jgi:hypothetical protein
MAWAGRRSNQEANVKWGPGLVGLAGWAVLGAGGDAAARP